MTMFKTQLQQTLKPTLLLSCAMAILMSGCSGTASTAAKPTTTERANAELVEIKLLDQLDESRGYCVDIAGGKGENAPLDRGLQAHTCYDYTGGLLVDQSFDAALMKQGQFKLPYFDVCMTASAIQLGANIELASCGNQDTQQFSLQSNGHLVTVAKPELCITVSSTEKRNGRGATPVHVMRPLSLQTCSDSNEAYQIWTTFKF